MSFYLKKIHHLIRYFVILGIVSFCGYAMLWNNNGFLALMGPPIFLAAELKRYVLPLVQMQAFSDTIELYVILLPLTIIYYGLCGFLLKQLWNERGIIRLLSLIGFIIFIVYIHWLTWYHLTVYFKPLV